MARKLPKEDATLMMDRAPAPQPRQGAVLPPPQRPAPVAHHQQTQQLGQPRPCAMCQTVNPIHVLACKACGVGLAPNEQDAVRARVRASMPVPPPHGPMYAQGQPRQPQQSFYPPPPGPHAPQWPAPPPATVWQRFLTWTGLRPR